MHIHYPNHILRRGVREPTECDPLGHRFRPGLTLDRMKRFRFSNPVRATILRIASALGSDPEIGAGPRVDLAELIKGRVGLAFSVLYSPFEEIDFNVDYGSPPEDEYFGELTNLMCVVEEEVNALPDDVIRLVQTPAQLAALEPGVIGIVHCVEGGFFLGPDQLEERAAVLRDHGVAYVTLAHLFWRRVAANANALPFLSDGWYHRLFRQPRAGSEDALPTLGEDAIAALTAKRIMVDVSHMREDVMHEAFDLLDDCDPGKTMPVIASHAGFRFGSQDYMLEADAIERIAERGGVVGLIMARHQLNDGSLTTDHTFDDAFVVICRHINRIAEITGSHKHVALGTDLDGFIKPLTGLDYAGDLARLEDRLIAEYQEDAALITSENARSVLEQAWSG